jgi:hypothetical protein
MSAVKSRLGARLAVAIAAATVGSLAIATGAMAEQPQSPTGSFVIGDQSVRIGGTVTFWGAQWWKDNSLSGGGAPPSFKGFADAATAQCGEQWTTRPGNSSDPPATLTGTVPMVVSSTVTKSGDVISGDTVAVVLVQVDPGYEGNPGHPGTGTVVGIVCDTGGVVTTRRLPASRSRHHRATRRGASRHQRHAAAHRRSARHR